jgi:hypothetical protein
MPRLPPVTITDRPAMEVNMGDASLRAGWVSGPSLDGLSARREGKLGGNWGFLQLTLFLKLQEVFSP